MTHIKAADNNLLDINWDTAKNNAATDLAGRPIFDKVLTIKVLSPGQPKSESIHEVIREFSNGTTRKNENMYRLYGPEIERFLALADNDGGDLGGTPLSQVPWVDSRLAMELKMMNIHTLEALRDLHDLGLQKIGPGARELQKKAKAYLDLAADTAATVRYSVENERQKTEIADLRGQVASLAGMVESLKSQAANAQGAPSLVSPVSDVTASANVMAGTEAPQPVAIAPGISAAMAASIGGVQNMIPDEAPRVTAGKKRGPKSKADKAALAANAPDKAA